MALGFIPSDAVMLAVQAGVVAAPRRPQEIRALSRLSGRLEPLSGPAWALIPLGSIIAVVFAIRYASAAATGLTYLALVAVPPLAAGALGYAARGARPWLALVTVPLFVLAWVDHASLAGEGAATLLSALSCVTLGVMLAAVTPPGWLKLGILAMAGADVWLVASDLLQAPNATLIAARPLGGLPRLQSELFGSVSMGYGDLFVAGLLGAVLAREGRGQRVAAGLTLALAGPFDLLFLVVNELPATVPVAVALILTELFARRRAAGSAPSLSLGGGS
ncbi:MAG: hypothetical protein M3016_11180 [Actinomycetota bacterium]|nr:hypothetical protein [Actinomycetota bacterium]